MATANLARPVHERMQDAIRDLKSLLDQRVTTAEVVREHHSHGESYHPAALPDAVCFPNSTAEVSEIMKISAKHQVPVIPFGAGTSMEAQVNAIHGGITIDMREMNKVVRISAEDLQATVEAGIPRKQLVKALANTGFTFFIDPGADATIGGMTSTRASGTTAVRYGTMRENVMALTVVLADGRIIKTGSRARKSAAGYDLTHLFVGAEGTLGVITEVTLRLHPQPEAVAAATCTFESIRDAVETAIETIQLGVTVARIELMDEAQIDACNRYSKTNYPVAPTLFFEFHGDSDRSVSEQAETVRKLSEEHRGRGFRWFTSPEERETLWKMRHEAYFANIAVRKGGKMFTTDICVPISRLADCIVESKKDVAGAPFPALVVGHVGDGNFHMSFILDPESPAELAEARILEEKIIRRALEMGGTCTGEHGIGTGRKKYLREEHGAGLDAMRAIKQAFDPDNRMNPGKMVDPQALFGGSDGA
ncbi:MAG: FAD-linked oxidase C-terminal domain-containing protein [Candidatus Acidoferrales bacterium]|nr:FAD-linked oxidase C-terminal domain-containing protein [Candidatus Acidoferrales bacterium]